MSSTKSVPKDFACLVQIHIYIYIYIGTYVYIYIYMYIYINAILECPTSTSEFLISSRVTYTEISAACGLQNGCWQAELRVTQAF